MRIRQANEPSVADRLQNPAPATIAPKADRTGYAAAATGALLLLGNAVAAVARPLSSGAGTAVQPLAAPTGRSLTQVAIPATPASLSSLTAMGSEIIARDNNASSIPRTFAPRGWGIPDTRHLGDVLCPRDVNYVKQDLDQAETHGVRSVRYLMYSEHLTDTVANNPAYLAETLNVMQYHLAKNPNNTFVLSLWRGPTTNTQNDVVRGTPTADTVLEARAIARAIKNEPRAIFDIGGQPANPQGVQNEAIGRNITAVVQAFRDEGATNLVLVPATQQFGRRLDYWQSHPLSPTANVCYTVQPYGNVTEVEQWLQPCKTQLCCTVTGFSKLVDPTRGINMTEPALERLYQLAHEANVPTYWEAFAGGELTRLTAGQSAAVQGECATHPHTFTPDGEKLLVLDRQYK